MLFMRQLTLRALMLAIWVALAVAPSSAFGASSHDTERTLRLLTTAESHCVPLGQPVTLAITLENAGDQYVVLYPFFSPPSSESSNASYSLNLEFEIVGPTGEPVGKLDSSASAKIKHPAPTDFLVIPPRYFWGVTLSLTEGLYSFDMTEPGTYEVRAHISSHARQWIRERIDEGAPEYDNVPFILENVLSGELEAPVLSLTLALPNDLDGNCRRD